MQSWPRWCQWLLVLILLSAILISVDVYPDFGIWVSILLGGPTVWLSYAISQPNRRRPVDGEPSKNTAPPSNASTVTLENPVLPKSYEFASGVIASIPGDCLAVRIGTRH